MWTKVIFLPFDRIITASSDLVRSSLSYLQTNADEEVKSKSQSDAINKARSQVPDKMVPPLVCKDRLLEFVLTAVHGESAESFLGTLRVREIESLGRLNKTWSKCHQIDWAMNGGGRQFLQTRCQHVSSSTEEGCISNHLLSTFGTLVDITWCEAHRAITGKPPVLVCPIHRKHDSAFRIHGYRGPLCMSCWQYLGGIRVKVFLRAAGVKGLELLREYGVPIPQSNGLLLNAL